MTRRGHQLGRQASGDQIQLDRVSALGRERNIVAVATGRAGVADDVDLEFNVGLKRCDAQHQRIEFFNSGWLQAGGAEIKIRLLSVVAVDAGDALLFACRRLEGGGRGVCRSGRRAGVHGSIRRCNDGRFPVRIGHALAAGDAACDFVGAKTGLWRAEFIAQHDHPALVAALAFKVAAATVYFA